MSCTCTAHAQAPLQFQVGFLVAVLRFGDMKFGVGGYSATAFFPAAQKPTATHAAAHTLAVARSAYFEVRAKAASEIRTSMQSSKMPLRGKLRQILRRRSRTVDEDDEPGSGGPNMLGASAIRLGKNCKEEPFEPPLQHNLEDSEDARDSEGLSVDIPRAELSFPLPFRERTPPPPLPQVN